MLFKGSRYISLLQQHISILWELLALHLIIPGLRFPQLIYFAFFLNILKSILHKVLICAPFKLGCIFIICLSICWRISDEILPDRRRHQSSSSLRLSQILTPAFYLSVQLIGGIWIQLKDGNIHVWMDMLYIWCFYIILVYVGESQSLKLLF